MTASVMCLGECLVDRLFELGESPHSSSNSGTDNPGGAPAKVAAAIAQLGSPTRLVSCLGQDDLGDWLQRVLQAQGVDCQLQRAVSVPTRTVLVQRDESGDRQFIGFSRPDATAFADAHLAPEWIDTLDFAEVDCLVMGTLGLAYPTTASAMTRAQQKVQAVGGKLVIDLNWRPVFWPEVELAAAQIRPFLATADLLKLSREEALWLLDTDSATEICQQFPRCQAVLLTDGSHGSTCATKHHTVSLPAFGVVSIDTTGAGDAFLAGVIHQLQQRSWDDLQKPAEVEEILRYASAVGALTTLKPGAIAAQPTPEEVASFLAQPGVGIGA